MNYFSISVSTLVHLRQTSWKLFLRTHVRGQESERYALARKKKATKRPPAPPSPLSFFLFSFTLMTSLEGRIRQKTLTKLRKHAVETRSSKVLLGLLTSTRYLQSWPFTLGKPLFYHLCKAIIAELIEN